MIYTECMVNKNAMNFKEAYRDGMKRKGYST